MKSKILFLIPICLLSNIVYKVGKTNFSKVHTKEEQLNLRKKFYSEFNSGLFKPIGYDYDVGVGGSNNSDNSSKDKSKVASNQCKRQ